MRTVVDTLSPVAVAENKAGYLCAQLAASQATSDGADRVLALGRLSMSYTIGAILGPALGATINFL